MAKVSGSMRAAKSKGVTSKATKNARAVGVAKAPAPSKKRSPGKARATKKTAKLAKPKAKLTHVAAPASKPRQTPKQKSAPVSQAAPVFNLSDVLAQSAWQEADEALARALRDFAALERISQRLSSRLRDGVHAADAGAVEDMMLAASQSLRQVGRKRGMQRFGEPGAIVAYDPGLHELTKAAPKPPSTVKIVAQGVQRGGGATSEIILKATVAPLRRRQSRAVEQG